MCEIEIVECVECVPKEAFSSVIPPLSLPLPYALG